MNEPPITSDVVKKHGLTEQEYERITQLLSRHPTFTELGIFSVMWSEHCSYKSSRVHLKRLPTKGEYVLQGPGENAGIIDIGGGLAAVFKIESHNHPSFIEPYQGAATGVGGILRDIFTMGARPVAAMNSLHFGPINSESDSESAKMEAARNRSIMAGVVRGVGDYGNSFGVADVGGEVRFAPVYSRNPLVNAFTLGLVRKEQIFYGKATGVGNPVIYVGAKTGRDGIHGATMASEEFDDQSQSKRPTVQVGDPFLEKLLLEACLESMRAGAIVGIQDMGAAGLTSSSCEMGGRAGNGIEIDVDLVPQRETGMSPYEIMLSESQERMLIVATAGHERAILDIFKKWELDAVVIGRVTGDGRLRVLKGKDVVADIPNSALTDSAPVYNRPIQEPAAAENRAVTQFEGSDAELEATFLKVIGAPNIACKEWVYRQYDHMVRTNTVVMPGSDAAVIRIKETRRALAMTLDSNARYCYLDPRAGARLAVAEACRNLAVSGARPVALTNCLNFASPERPDIMWQFSETVDGIGEACTAMGTPVTGGNVSFYNETEGSGIYPTPVIGMVGIIEDVRHVTTQWFKREADVIVLLGETVDDLGGSEYLLAQTPELKGRPPALDLARERAVMEACLKMIGDGLIESAHDCSDGGAAVALAESAFSSFRRPALGIEVDLTGDLSAAALLFSESPSRVIISAQQLNVDKILSVASDYGVPATVLGRTGGDRISIKVNGKLVIDKAVSEVESIWRNLLPGLLEEPSLIAAEESLTG
ncbi:MAG TPA: phosphoribosylformylglycinamidine synthase subunit PurL [Blastocatellia bacterium]